MSDLEYLLEIKEKIEDAKKKQIKFKTLLDQHSKKLKELCNGKKPGAVLKKLENQIKEKEAELKEIISSIEHLMEGQ